MHILTSSSVAVLDLAQHRAQDESDWCNLDTPGVTPYARSKTLAERAAWALADEKGLRLTSINPGLVLGLPLDEAYGSSVRLICRILSGKDPMQPDIGFPVVGVRDVATMRLRALARPDSIGNRIIASAGSLSLAQTGLILEQVYPNRRIAMCVAPGILLRILALFDPEVRSILPALGHIGRVSDVRAISALGMCFIAPEEAVLAAEAFVVAEAT